MARLRAHGDLVELRAADLRFTPDEAAAYFAAAAPDMDARATAALVEKTDGWVAGLQLAALSLRGYTDIQARVKGFTGNDAFVLDYLVEEVLTRQPTELQRFLFTTAVLERLCGPLCDALTDDAPGSGQAMLEAIERANLCLIPLDSERRWYRYHHLFADMLRQRAAAHMDLPALHQRASQWYEAHDLLTEAFGHAAAAGDLDAAERLLDGGGTPLAYRGAPAPVVRWLASLPASVLNMRPALWVAFASAGMISGEPMHGIEARLNAAETALRLTDENAHARDLIGQIAAIHGTLAINTGDAAALFTHSQQALDYLPEHRVALRASALYTLGYAQQLRGERSAARQSYHAVLAISESTDNTLITIAVLTCLGQVEESDLYPDEAAAFFQRVLRLPTIRRLLPVKPISA